MTNDAGKVDIDAEAFKKWREWLNSPAGETILKKCATSVIRKATNDGIPLTPWTDLADKDDGQQRAKQESVATHLWMLLVGAPKTSVRSATGSSETVDAVNEGSDIGEWLKGLIQASSTLSQAELEQRIIRKALNALKEHKRSKKNGESIAFRYKAAREIISKAARAGKDFTYHVDKAVDAFYFAACQDEGMLPIPRHRLAEESFAKWDFPRPDSGRAPTSSKSFILKAASLFWNQCVSAVGVRGLVPGQTFVFALEERFGPVEGSRSQEVQSSNESYDELPAGVSNDQASNAPWRAQPPRPIGSPSEEQLRGIARDAVASWPETWRKTYLLMFGEEDVSQTEIAKRLACSDASITKIKHRIRSSLLEYASQWPGLSQPDYDKEVMDEFRRALLQACKTSLHSRNTE